MSQKAIYKNVGNRKLPSTINGIKRKMMSFVNDSSAGTIQPRNTSAGLEINYTGKSLVTAPWWRHRPSAKLQRLCLLACNLTGTCHHVDISYCNDLEISECAQWSHAKAAHIFLRKTFKLTTSSKVMTFHTSWPARLPMSERVRMCSVYLQAASFFSPHYSASDAMRWERFGTWFWSSQNKTEKYSSPALACLCVEWEAAEVIYTRPVRPDAACIGSYVWRHSHAYSTNAHAHNQKIYHTHAQNWWG